MKYSFALILIVSICLFSCSGPDKEINIFTESHDTLIISSHKVKGIGLFLHGAGPLTFRDTSDWKSLDWFRLYPDYKITYPNNIQNIKLGFFSLMIRPLRYYDYETGEEYFQENLSVADKQMIVISGIMEDDTVFVVDANNNKDLSDDTIRVFKTFDWIGNKNLIKCYYSVQRKNEIKRDSGWIQIGKGNYGILDYSAQYMEANLIINKNIYKIGVIDDNSGSFCFFTPMMALLSENGNERDTLLLRDYVKLEDYIKLGEYYYKFYDFFSGGGTIVLTKEEDYSNKIGVQAGMLAPDFRAKTLSGDTINSTDFEGKKIMVANFSGCTSRSYDVYRNIVEVLGDKIVIIGLESGIDENIGGILIDVEEEYNNDIYKSFRNAYSSYDCYLIEEDGRISKKFSIFDWEVYLKDTVETITNTN